MSVPNHYQPSHYQARHYGVPAAPAPSMMPRYASAGNGQAMMMMPRYASQHHQQMPYASTAAYAVPRPFSSYSPAAARSASMRPSSPPRARSFASSPDHGYEASMMRSAPSSYYHPGMQARAMSPPRAMSPQAPRAMSPPRYAMTNTGMPRPVYSRSRGSW